MAEPQPGDGSSASNAGGGSSESSLQLNIKTLDSRIYSFDVDKNIVVAAFKEKIAAQSGVPVGQQRLIFRGKVLKDDHLLSEYNVENGDTLHLVERQPQPSSGSSTGEATSSNDSRAAGQNSNNGGQRHRIGPIAHSIVLGTLNVGDPGEAVVPDLSQVIGAVFNTIGIDNQASGLQPGVPVSHGNEADGSQSNAVGQNQGGNQSVPWQAFSGQSAPGAAIAIPSLNLPIPESLSTLIEFMNQMQRALLQDGDQTNQSTASGSEPATELPLNTRGFPTIEGLSIVLQRAQNLLSDHVVPAISRTAARLNQERGSNDPAVREQVQTESIQLGMAMQHLGALFLELGRTALSLRMGQSPVDSFVNAGPAVYISPSGPNPIMVQPFPLQTSSLFGGSSGASRNPSAVGPAGIASVPRNVNIHIHTGAALVPTTFAVGSRAPNGENTQRERVNVTEAAGSGQARSSLGAGVMGAAPQLEPITFSVSGAAPSSTGVSQSSDSNSISPIVAEINSQIRRSLIANLQRENYAPSGLPDGSANQGEHVGFGASIEGSVRTGETSHLDDQKVRTAPQEAEGEPSGSSGGDSRKKSVTSNQGNSEGSSDVPIGLGVGGLQPKRRGSQPRAQTKDSGGPSASSQNQQSLAVGQHVLQSLASLSTGRNSNPPLQAQSSNVSSGVGGSMPIARQNAEGHGDIAEVMSEMLQGPGLDGLLTGVSQQTGMGSPDMLRNMLQQFTQNPAMRNTMNQIAQQIDKNDLGGMVSGLDRGPGGGIDLSTMMQQMMPIVSKALGGVSSVSEQTAPSQPVLLENRSRSWMTGINDDPQSDLRQVVQRLVNQSSPAEIFRSLADRAVNIYSDGSATENMIDELCDQEGLAQEFMGMLYRDISRRFHDDTGLQR